MRKLSRLSPLILVLILPIVLADCHGICRPSCGKPRIRARSVEWEYPWLFPWDCSTVEVGVENTGSARAKDIYARLTVYRGDLILAQKMLDFPDLDEGCEAWDSVHVAEVDCAEDFDGYELELFWADERGNAYSGRY